MLVYLLSITDRHPGDESPRHDSGSIEIVRRHNEGRAGDLASAGHILALVSLCPVQLEPQRAGLGTGTGNEEPRPGDGQLLQ